MSRSASSPEVYTPALIVDGKLDAVGSDGAAVDHTLRRGGAGQETAAQIDVQRGAAGLTVSVGAGAGNGTLLLIGYDRLHQTPVVRGENGGRTLRKRISSVRCRYSAPGRASRFVCRSHTRPGRKSLSCCSAMTDISSVPELLVRRPAHRDSRDLVGGPLPFGGRTRATRRMSTPLVRSLHAIQSTTSLPDRLNYAHG